MRIAHISATFPPYWGGAGNVCFHNALELARHGHQVTVFTADLGQDYPYPPEINVRRLLPLFRIGNAPLLPGLLGIKDFDLIHLQYPFIFGTELVWIVSKIRRIPFLITYQNDLIGDGLRYYLFEIYSKVLSSITFRAASKLLVLSKDHALHCHQSNLFRKFWNKVIELPNGVDTQTFRPGIDGKSTRHQLSISEKQKVILFVGGLDRAHHFKGVNFLLEAFHKIDIPESVLVIIGEGDLKDQYITRSKELGISERVRFSGAIANENLPPYYAISDVFVLPSSPPESFGIVLIEAMACGKPVIASDIPGVRSVISDGIDGFLSRPGDVEHLAERIITILNKPDIKQSMGLKGREKAVEKYRWGEIGNQLNNIYELFA